MMASSSSMGWMQPALSLGWPLRMRHFSQAEDSDLFVLVDLFVVHYLFVVAAAVVVVLAVVLAADDAAGKASFSLPVAFPLCSVNKKNISIRNRW